MSEKPEDQASNKPAPTEESDANRVTKEEADARKPSLDKARRSAPNANPADPCRLTSRWWVPGSPVSPPPTRSPSVGLRSSGAALFLAGDRMFKHAPLIGRMLANAVLERQLPALLRPEARLGAAPGAGLLRAG